MHVVCLFTYMLIYFCAHMCVFKTCVFTTCMGCMIHISKT